MSTIAADSRPRAMLSGAGVTLFAVIAAMTFSAGGAAPTPLYRHYQESLGLTPAMVTIIFAAYALSLLLALLTVGSLSDHIGRRPVIFAALGLNILAMSLFIMADSAALLVIARAVQGFATGAATTALGAAILDTNRSRGPLLNSITAFAGLTIGSLGSGVLVSFAPDPTMLVYIVLLALTGLEILVLQRVPETARSSTGALRSLLPHINVPAKARRAFTLITPVNIAAWALGGFYFSLMPAIVRSATGATLPLVGGLVVAGLTGSGTLAVLWLRNLAPNRILAGGTVTLALGVAITLIGVRSHLVTLMMLGAIVSGLGFGAVFSGSIRMVMPMAQPQERAGLLAAFYIEGYLAFSLPAILTGFLAPLVGLAMAATIYGFGVIGLAALALVTLLPRSSPASRSPKIQVCPMIGCGT